MARRGIVFTDQASNSFDRPWHSQSAGPGNLELPNSGGQWPVASQEVIPMSSQHFITTYRLMSYTSGSGKLRVPVQSVQAGPERTHIQLQRPFGRAACSDGHDRCQTAVTRRTVRPGRSGWRGYDDLLISQQTRKMDRRYAL